MRDLANELDAFLEHRTPIELELPTTRITIDRELLDRAARRYGYDGADHVMRALRLSPLDRGPPGHIGRAMVADAVGEPERLLFPTVAR